MRDLGIHTLPVPSTLPGSGLVGQQVCVGNQVYYWDGGLQAWQPICEDLDLVLAANYTNTTTTMSAIFSIPVVSGGIYEVSWTLMWQTSLLSATMKQTFTSPSGSTQNIISMISGTQSGTTTPMFMELNTSGTSQTGPTNGIASTYTLNTGRGSVSAGSAGSVSLMGAMTSGGMLTIAKGGVFHCRRVA